jgi:hypothetical protein
MNDKVSLDKILIATHWSGRKKDDNHVDALLKPSITCQECFSRKIRTRTSMISSQYRRSGSANVDGGVVVAVRGCTNLLVSRVI